MDRVITVSDIIKKYIELRGKTVKLIAAELGIPYTTFSAKLKRDSIDVYLLFRLNNLLDMDINWMANVLEHQKRTSFLDSLQISRMSEDLRKQERVHIEKAIRRIIKENPIGVADARNSLLADYNTFYLLDVLLEENIQIFVINERCKEKYYCTSKTTESYSKRRYPFSLIDGREMIDILIAERK